MGKTEPLAREGSQGRWPVPTTPSAECAPGSYQEVTRVGGHEGESPWRVTEGVPTKRGGAASTLGGEESVMLRGCGRAPPLGLARALLTARSGPATAAASAPVTDRQAGRAGTGRGPQRGAGCPERLFPAPPTQAPTPPRACPDPARPGTARHGTAELRGNSFRVFGPVLAPARAPPIRRRNGAPLEAPAEQGPAAAHPGKCSRSAPSGRAAPPGGGREHVAWGLVEPRGPLAYRGRQVLPVNPAGKQQLPRSV